jgi:hypothetical protein
MVSARMVKKILLGIVVVLLGLQLFRPARNLATEPPGKDDLVVRYRPPQDVQRILEKACYDCHSNNTRYPWYANVQPVGWWLADHIKDGKRALNFSVFGSYPLARQGKKLDHISDEVSEKTMPLPSYTWIHRSAKLTDAEIKTLTDWADALHDQILPDSGS